MSWKTILKMNPATRVLQEHMLKIKKDTIPYDIQTMIMTYKMFKPVVDDIDQAKKDLRERIEQVYLDPKMVRAWFNNDIGYQKLLQDKNIKLEDIEWDEVLIPIVAEYDKVIDALTLGDFNA